MTVDITTLPTSELLKDLLDSQDDIKVCQFALDNGVNQYGRESVQRRLDANKYFVEVITAELERRGLIP